MSLICAIYLRLLTALLIRVSLTSWVIQTGGYESRVHHVSTATAVGHCQADCVKHPISTFLQTCPKNNA